jgi:LmbE family N-acetylglucosaminyl deacetylase
MSRPAHAALAMVAAATVALTAAATWSGCTRPAASPPRRVQIVAHQDDDLMFMNPELERAIRDGETVTTVFVTAGAQMAEREYGAAREAGIRAAYARMAGVADSWNEMDGPVHSIALAARPDVSLVFFRLPQSASEAGAVGAGASANLQALWIGEDPATATKSPEITSVDAEHRYTRESLIAALAAVLVAGRPDLVAILDDSGYPEPGQDPSGIRIEYEALAGRCYFYDHSDHYYSARFAAAAIEKYGGQPTVLRHRGYNMAGEAANLTGEEARAKSEAFEAYAEHDKFVPDDPPFGVLYDPWIRRRYLAGSHAAPVRHCP